MATYAEAREAQAPDELRAAWDGLTTAWGDPARHDHLMVLVARHNCFAWAAGRYRDAARARPHDPIAPRQLERVRRAGEATLFATASTRADKVKTPYTRCSRSSACWCSRSSAGCSTRS